MLSTPTKEYLESFCLSFNDIGILGAGGFAREVHRWSFSATRFNSEINKVTELYDGSVKEPFYFGEYDKIRVSNQILDIPYAIGVGEPSTKIKLLSNIDVTKLKLTRIIHERAIFGDHNPAAIGEGSVVCPGVIITTNVRIGKFVTLNLNATIGHDTVIGDYCNVAPGANISGNCILGNRVSIGTNAAIREKITICDDVTIGMGAIVVKDITEPGVYVGNPARKLNGPV